MLKPIFLSLLLPLALLTACGQTDAVESPSPPELTPAQSEETLHLCIVDGADSGSLLLAGEGSGEVYALTVTEETPIYLNGSPAAPADLEDGMPIQVFYTGGIEEIWPAVPQGVTKLNALSPGTAENPGGSYYDLCGLFLQVLDDLWNRDAGLNEGITCISVDLSEAPGDLTDGEKAAVAHRFAALHGDALSAFTYTYEELAEQGYLSGGDPASGEMPQWKDGLLFRITPVEGSPSQSHSLPALHFNASKWRSALGGYGFTDCTAVWPEMGAWTEYAINGGEYIS